MTQDRTKLFYFKENQGDEKTQSSSNTNEVNSQFSFYEKVEFWSKNGLSKEEVKRLLNKYPSPPNVIVPTLNPELAAILPSDIVEQDNYMKKTEELLRATFTCSLKGMTIAMEPNNFEKTALIELLYDAGKLLAHTLYRERKALTKNLDNLYISMLPCFHGKSCMRKAVMKLVPKEAVDILLSSIDVDPF